MLLTLKTEPSEARLLLEPLPDAGPPQAREAFRGSSAIAKVAKVVIGTSLAAENETMGTSETFETVYFRGPLSIG